MSPDSRPPESRPEPSGSAPSLAEFTAEALDLGRMAGSWWVSEIERAVASTLATPARKASSAFGALATTRLRRLGLTGTDRAATTLPVSGGPGGRPPTLRESGAELLRRSADVRETEDPHPAYRRILEELAPDEARILRLLATEGPRPVVDIRAGIPPMTRLVETDLTLAAIDAGCRLPGRAPVYLDNLRRLGLVAVAPEAVGDPDRYQLLEAQPEVTDSIEAAGRTARTVRRRLELTGFGEDFFRVCFPLEPARQEVLIPS